MKKETTTPVTDYINQEFKRKLQANTHAKDESKDVDDKFYLAKCVDRAYSYLFALGYFTTPTREGAEVEVCLINAKIGVPELINENEKLKKENDALVSALKMVLWDMKNGEGEAQRQGKPRYCDRKEIIESILQSINKD